jgi:hypothetical protein
MGFKQLKSNRSLCLYSQNNVQITVPVYIDDITLAFQLISAVDKVVGELVQHFKLRSG